MEALGLREMLEPVPVKIRLAAVLPASLLFMTADWAAALMMVGSSPSRLATELARPVSVWVEAPVKRIRLTLPKFRLFRLPVVATSVPFLKATLDVTSRLAPRLVLPPLTLKVLVPAMVVSPFRVLAPVLDWKVPLAK